MFMLEAAHLRINSPLTDGSFRGETLKLSQEDVVRLGVSSMAFVATTTLRNASNGFHRLSTSILVFDCGNVETRMPQ